MTNMIDAPVEQGLRLLAAEHPDWLPVVEAALSVAREAEAAGVAFAGAAVVEELARRGEARRVPNLRLLVSYGVLEKSGPSMGAGRRAYYRMPDPAAVAAVLDALGRRRPRALRFIAAGASAAPPADTGRRAGEIAYEPRSWR